MEQINYNVSGGRVAGFQIAAQPNKEPVLLIHGYPDDHRSWEFQLPFLSEDFNAVTIDLPGVGKSFSPARSDEMHVESMRETLFELIEQFGKGKPVHIIAHDWGALISWGLVTNKNYAKLIKSFSSISGPHPAIARQNLFEKVFGGALHQQEQAIEQFRKSWYIFFFQVPFLPEFLWNTFPKQIMAYFLREANLKEFDPMYMHSPEEIKSKVIKPLELYRQLLQGRPDMLPRKVETPCQVIIPQEDSMISPSLYDNLIQYAPHAEIRHVHGNHWVHREKPDQVNEILINFMNACS